MCSLILLNVSWSLLRVILCLLMNYTNNLFRTYPQMALIAPASASRCWRGWCVDMVWIPDAHALLTGWALTLDIYIKVCRPPSSTTFLSPLGSRTFSKRPVDASIWNACKLKLTIGSWALCLPVEMKLGACHVLIQYDFIFLADFRTLF